MPSCRTVPAAFASGSECDGTAAQSLKSPSIVIAVIGSPMAGGANTGDFALGAFDVEVTFDPEVVTAVSVDAGADVQDAVFSSNTKGQPGKVLFNGTLPVSGVARKGPAIRLATIHFTAAPQPGVTTVSGTVQTIVALDTVQPIGPETPRALVAGQGDLSVE